MFFKNKNKPEMSELIYWFQKTQTKLANSMKESRHNAEDNNANAYHMEDSVWTHTMMVCLMAEIESQKEYDKLQMITALLHDIGKPMSREEEVIEYENTGDRVKITRFKGHEGASYHLSISVLNDLQKEGVIDEKDKQLILKVIAFHGVLFDYIKDGKMYKPENIFSKFTEEEFILLIKQVRNDSLGRFAKSDYVKKEEPQKLGVEIYTLEQYREFKRKEKEKLAEKEEERKKYNKTEYIKNKKLTVLIGPQGVGKSTWIKNNKKEEDMIISRDNEVLLYGKEKYGLANTSKIFEKLTEEENKKIDANLLKKFHMAVKSNKNIIVDMTNTSKKSRRKWVNGVRKNYKKEAILFQIEESKRKEQLEKREGKDSKLLKNKDYTEKLLKTFTYPTLEEFDEIKIKQSEQKSVKMKQTNEIKV